MKAAIKIFLLLFAVIYASNAYSQVKLSPCQYLPELVPFTKGKKVGYVNRQGEVVIPAKFDKAYLFGWSMDLYYSNAEQYHSDQFATVKVKGIAYRIDMAGRKVLRLDTVKYQNLDMKAVQDDGEEELFSEAGKWGVKRWGNVAIPAQYDNLQSLSPDLYLAYKDGKYGMINIQNQVVFPFQYDDIRFLLPDHYLAYKNGKCGVLNLRNQEVVPIRYDSLENLNQAWILSNGIVLEAYSNGKRVIVDLCGNEITLP